MSLKRLHKVREKRVKRVRGKFTGTEERPRLSVFRSARHIYAQAVVDEKGRTIAAASTLSKELQGNLGGLKKAAAAKEVGKLIAQKLLSHGIEAVVFDRGAFLYHGRVKALAEGAREAGLRV